MAGTRITINRAPVLTLWAAVVARRLGYAEDEALSLGKAVSGLTAQAKGRTLGIYERKTGPSQGPRGEESWVVLCGRAVPVRRVNGQVRAVSGAEPVQPEPVERYLDRAFGVSLQEARTAFECLAATLDPAQTPDTVSARALELYEQFRPAVPAGRAGWGSKGVLDLEGVRDLARMG